MSHSSLPRDHEIRMERVRLSLDGLSVGDAFGERFFWDFDRPTFLIDQERAAALTGDRVVPPAPWPYTDDTAMALGIAEVLNRHGRADRDELARRFADRYWKESRGYGATAIEILEAIHDGTPWQEAAGDAFEGDGSMGNGAAMRVAPLGAYFADDLATVVSEARASADVTHAHPEGQAGAIAVAVAATTAWRLRERTDASSAHELLRVVLDHTPPGPTREGIIRASELPLDAPVERAVARLGNGSRVTAPDTVPFCLWCAARHLDNYVEAMWTTVSGLGDRDTTCAIVGGIVVLATGKQDIPVEWLSAREAWMLDDPISPPGDARNA